MDFIDRHLLITLLASATDTAGCACQRRGILLHCRRKTTMVYV
jgi:hypothetical protein